MPPLLRLLLLLFLLFLLFFPSAAADEACPIVLQHPAIPRIIGGIPAPEPTLSFLAALFHPNNTFACTASVLSSRWLLTAAHCQVRPNWNVRVGGVSAMDGALLPIKRVHTHEAYRKGVFDAPGDIALIELADPIPPPATTVLVNSNNSIPIRGSFARSAGYGWKLPNVMERNPEAYQVDAPVNSPVKCSTLYSSSLNIRPKYFTCVGYENSACRANSCNGDSGGPLVQYNQRGDPVQIGIVAFGMKCGDEGVPGVYVKVSAFVDWLKARDAVFKTSPRAVSTFSTGSKEAASDISTLQAESMSESGSLAISRVWFIVLCLVAAVATIALIFVCLAYFSGVRKARNTSSRYPSSAEQSAGFDHDSLQVAISILQSIAISSSPDRPPESTQFSEASREVPPPGTDIVIDEVTPRGRHAVNRLHPGPGR